MYVFVIKCYAFSQSKEHKQKRIGKGLWESQRPLLIILTL